MYDSCYPVNQHHVERKVLTVSLFSEATSLSSYTGSDWLTSQTAALVSPLIPLTWQALPCRPWPPRPDWIKSLPGWRIECCCQLDISTSPTFPLLLPLPNSQTLAAPLLSASFRRESRFKASLLPPSSQLVVVPLAASQPWGNKWHCEDFPASLGSSRLSLFSQQVLARCKLGHPVALFFLEQVDSHWQAPLQFWSTHPPPPPLWWRTWCFLRSTYPLICIHI